VKCERPFFAVKLNYSGDYFQFCYSHIPPVRSKKTLSSATHLPSFLCAEQLSKQASKQFKEKREKKVVRNLKRIGLDEKPERRKEWTREQHSQKMNSLTLSPRDHNTTANNDNISPYCSHKSSCMHSLELCIFTCSLLSAWSLVENGNFL